MATANRQHGKQIDTRYLVGVSAFVLLAVLSITWVSIRKSRSDSLRLLIDQGTAFTEALAQASKTAAIADEYYLDLIRARYHDIVLAFTENLPGTPDDAAIADFLWMHDIEAVYVFDSTGHLNRSLSVKSPRANPPEFVFAEVDTLLANPDSNFVLILQEGETPEQLTHFYFEISNQLDRVIVLKVRAKYHAEALRQTGIGYLAQNIARETGVEYIIFQTPAGIVFASRKPGPLPAIEADPFLQAALESDTIMHRLYDFQGSRVLELVRPYTSPQYSFGLFRVGLSLRRYADVSRSFDRQLLLLSGSFALLMAVLLLYFNSRRRRYEISRRYSQMKNVTDRILQQMGAGVVVVDADGSVCLANAAAERLLGRRDIVGQTWSSLVQHGRFPLPTSPSRLLTCEGQEFRLTVGGQTRTVIVSSSPVGGEGELHDAVVLVMSDITALKEYEQQAARRERLSEMGTLAAGVAHEIRNPLNTIAIAAQRLAEEFTPDRNPDAYRSFTDRIRSEAKRLNDIITRFLALARERSTSRQLVPLDTFVASIRDLLSDDAARSGVTVEFAVAPGMTVSADTDKLKQVFLNLFNNSRTAFQGKAGRIRVSVQQENGQVVIRFADSGPGIPAELREKVLTPFFTTHEDGTGLGLSTVYQIIQDLGGDMSIESGELGGTTIVMKLPLAAGA